MVGNVYRNARTTLVWLGPGPDRFSGVVQATQNCIKSRNKWSSRLWQGRPWQDLTAEEKTEYESNARDDFGRDTFFEEVDTLTQLLDCAWFRRARAVQEAALSRDVLIFWSNGGYVTWDALDATVDLLVQHKYRILATTDLQFDHKRIIKLLTRFLDSADHFRRIDGLRSMLQNGRQLNSLLIFFLLSNSIATDKRDHVYSGLGMLSDSTIIRVDYDLDVSEVLTKPTQVLMENNNDIHILSLCQGSRIPNLPSWSVDFTLHPCYSNLASSQIYAPSDRRYSAGGNTPAIFGFKDKTLILRGILISELSFVGSRKANTNFWDKILEEEHSDTVKITGTMADFNQEHEELFIKNSRELQQAWLGEWVAHEEEMGSTAHAFEKYPWTQEDI